MLERTRLSQAQRDQLMAQLQDQLRQRVHIPGTSLAMGMGYGSRSGEPAEDGDD